MNILNENDLLSKLKGKDVVDLIRFSLNNEYIYRSSLDLPEHLTFGLEIEYEISNNEEIKAYLKKIKNWFHCSEGSLTEGGEIISPILTDKIKYWEQLRQICNYLKSKNVDVKTNAGAHVHIGANVIGDNYLKWIEFIKFYIYYENIIYRYSYGEELYGRKKIKEYAEPIGSRLYEEFYLFGNPDSLKRVFNKVPNSRHYSINFTNVKKDKVSEIIDGNTIEFRSPNGTINEKIWQNNVNTFAKMLLAVMKDKVDTEYIDYEIKSEETCFNKDFYYNEVYLEKALEFVDIIFDNNLDKIMFLKQYIKDFDSVSDKIYVKM